MSGSYRDAKGGHSKPDYAPYGIEGQSEFKRACRRSARNKAKRDMRRGREPLPKYSVQCEYWEW